MIFSSNIQQRMEVAGGRKDYVLPRLKPVRATESKVLVMESLYHLKGLRRKGWKRRQKNEKVSYDGKNKKEKNPQNCRA